MTAEELNDVGDESDAAGWSPNLLTHIATTIGRRQRENVATAALLYVMQNDVAVRRAVVADLAQRAGLSLDVDLPRDLVFVPQDFGVGGRPDAVGHDGESRRRVVIEAKIDAGFQSQQIARYSTQLDPDVPCLIAVLAPERRLPRLLQEANGQLAAVGQVLDRLNPTKWQSADRTVTLLGVSWTETLDAMTNVTSSPDVTQLRGFYDYLDSGTFLPFSGADLAAANGRLMRSITSVAKNVAEGLPAAERIGPKHDWSSVGWFLTLNGRRAWFGVWLEHWARRADTPYWLTYSKGVLPIADAASLLTRLNVLPDISAHQEHDGSYLCVAMFPPMEADRGNVEGELTKLIRQVAQVVQ